MGAVPTAAKVASQFVVARIQGRGTARDSKTTRLQKLRGEIQDPTTNICAVLSAWVYSTGKELVLIKDKFGNGAAAYRHNIETTEVDGFIEDGRVLPKLAECVHNAEDYVQVRFLGMAVWVKRHHTSMVRKQTVDEGDDRKEEVVNALKNVLPADTKVSMARFRHNGVLLPSGVTVVLDETCDGKTCSTVIVAWQGTQADQRPMDLFTDASGMPIAAGLWYDNYPNLRAHGGMYGVMQTEFLDRRKDLITMLQGLATKGCVRLIFTGHSLGGGIALLAHMASMVEVEKMEKDGRLGHLKNVGLSSIVFAAPMVFYYDPPEQKEAAEGPSPTSSASAQSASPPTARGRCRTRPKTEESPSSAVVVDDYSKLQELFKATSVNYVFDKDILPRMPGCPKFVKKAGELAAKGLARQTVAARINVDDSAACLNLIEDFAKESSAMFLESSTIKKTFEALQHFSHFSTVQHWKADLAVGAEGKPEVQGETEIYKEFVEEDGDDWKYFLACHSWFPNNILKLPPDILTAATNAAAS